MTGTHSPLSANSASFRANRSTFSASCLQRFQLLGGVAYPMLGCVHWRLFNDFFGWDSPLLFQALGNPESMPYCKDYQSGDDHKGHGDYGDHPALEN